MSGWMRGRGSNSGALAAVAMAAAVINAVARGVCSWAVSWTCRRLVVHEHAYVYGCWVLGYLGLQECEQKMYIHPLGSPAMRR